MVKTKTMRNATKAFFLILALVLAAGLALMVSGQAGACTSVKVTSSACGNITIYKSSSSSGPWTYVDKVSAGESKTLTTIEDNKYIELVSIETNCCKFLRWTGNGVFASPNSDNTPNISNPVIFNKGQGVNYDISGKFVATPTAGTATVNGNTTEWNLTNDFYDNMYQAWRLDKPIESKLYLRYDCSTQTLYVLVLTQPGVQVIASQPSYSYVKIDGSGNTVVDGNSGNNGTPPDFAWVSLGVSGNCTGNNTYALGWEASIPNVSEGNHTLWVHTQVCDSGSQTSGTVNQWIPLPICCPAQLRYYGT